MTRRSIALYRLLVACVIFSCTTQLFSQKLTAADTARVREEVLESSYPSAEQIDSLLDFDVTQWDIWQKKAIRQIGDSEYPEAEQSIANGIKYAPKGEYWGLYVSFAYGFGNQEPRNVALAVKYAELAIKEKPNDWTAHFVKAFPYLLDSMYKEAEAPLKRAVELAAEDEKGKEIKPKLTQMLGYAIHKNGRSDEGLKLFNTAIDLPTRAEGDASEKIMRSEIYEDRKEYEKAIADITAAQAIESNPYTLQRRAKLYDKLGKKDEALFDAITAAQSESDLMAYQQELATKNGVTNGVLDLKEGMKLTYMLGADDDQVVINVKKLTNQKIIFDYQYKSNPTEKGTVTLEKDAIMKGKQYAFNFSSETDKNAIYKGEDDKSSLFLSVYAYENLVKNGLTTLIVEEVTDDFTPDETQTGLLVLVKGKWMNIATKKGSGKEEGGQIEVLENPKFPLIVSILSNTKFRLFRVD